MEFVDGLDALPNNEGTAALEYFAKNETRAVAREEEDEKMVRMGRTLQAASRRDEENYQTLRREGRAVKPLTTHYDEALDAILANKTNRQSKYSRIFMCPETRRFLQLLLTLPLHFRTSGLFKLAFLNNFTNRYGGVSENNIDSKYLSDALKIATEWVQMSYDIMTRSSVVAETTIPQLDTVRDTIAKNDESQLYAWKKQICSEQFPTNVDVWDGTLLAKLDSIFDCQFRGEDGEYPNLAVDSDAARQLWEEYRTAIVDAIVDYESKNPIGFPVNLSARVAILLYWGPSDKNIPHPLLTSHAVYAYTTMLRKIILVIVEVSLAMTREQNSFVRGTLVIKYAYITRIIIFVSITVHWPADGTVPYAGFSQRTTFVVLQTELFYVQDTHAFFF